MGNRGGDREHAREAGESRGRGAGRPGEHRSEHRARRREIVRPERLVATEKFDEAWYPGEAVGTVHLAAKGGRTLLTQTLVYESREARDIALKSGMESGMADGYDRLEKILAR